MRNRHGQISGKAIVLLDTNKLLSQEVLNEARIDAQAQDKERPPANEVLYRVAHAHER